MKSYIISFTLVVLILLGYSAIVFTSAQSHEATRASASADNSEP